MTTFEYEQAALNAKGQIGWEVFSISSSEFANIGHTAFLKRETSEAADVGDTR